MRNERTKLPANALDRTSTACFTVGIATPLTAPAYNIGNFRANMQPDALALGMAARFLAAVALPLKRRRVLGTLRP